MLVDASPVIFDFSIVHDDNLVKAEKKISQKKISPMYIVCQCDNHRASSGFSLWFNNEKPGPIS